MGYRNLNVVETVQDGTSASTGVDDDQVLITVSPAMMVERLRKRSLDRGT